MSRPLPYGYYYGNEADQYTFYRLPKALFTNGRYKTLSDGAKILYGLMLDRMSLSSKNGWFDEQNRIYIIFTLENVQEYMNCKHEKAVKLLAELDTEKGVGLIERIRRGQGLPSITYVRKFFDASEVLTSENQKSGLPDLPKSRLPKNRSQEFRKTEANNTDINNTDLSDNHQSIYPVEGDAVFHHSENRTRIDKMDEIEAYREILYENLGYEVLCDRYGSERMDEVVELLLEAICSSRKYIRIAGDEFPKEVVKSRFLKLDSSHIEYAFECLDKSTTKVHNIKSYLLTTFYNTFTSIDSYYRAEVQHDLYSGDST